MRYYGRWMRDRAWERIGHLYPKGPNGETIIAWLWARTVKCPNPACGADTPLVRSFWLSTKKGKEAWVEPIVDREAKTVHFKVHHGPGEPPPGTKDRREVYCVVCREPIPERKVPEQATNFGYGESLMALVAEGNRQRNYLSPAGNEVPSIAAPRAEFLEQELPKNPRWFSPPAYGLKRYADLFTPRQLVALTTFSDLVGEARELALRHAREAGMPDDGLGIDAGGSGATAYADAIATYLAFAVDRSADYWSSLCSWHVTGEKIRNTFGRQALPMVWDFAETNPFSESTGSWLAMCDWVWKAVRTVPHSGKRASCKQLDAVQSINGVDAPMIATDPPYYDNIGYADLSDFFYVWLRRSLRDIYARSGLFDTLLTPKEQELVATPYRFGGSRQKAQEFFREGLERALTNARRQHAADYPLTLYYAFKQTEEEEREEDLPLFAGKPAGRPPRTSTGWEAMLEGLVASGFAITATVPVRSELANRTVARETNALGSSIVIACRPRPEDAPTAEREEYLNELESAIGQALPFLVASGTRAVDLAQAVIGPGMAVYSKYGRVLRQNGQTVTVREALQDIGAAFAKCRRETAGRFDERTRFCIEWYDDFGLREAAYDDAVKLARATNVGVNVLEEQHLLETGRGKARLVPFEECPAGVAGLAARPFRGSDWEACLRLAVTLRREGIDGVVDLGRQLGESACRRGREVAVWLYTIAEARRRTDDALLFNSLDASWPEIETRLKQLERGEQTRAL